MAEIILPAADRDDDDDIVLALETARISIERHDLEAAIKWLGRAASQARAQGRPERAGVFSRNSAKISGALSAAQALKSSLQDIEEDDYSELTIVETAEQIAAKSKPVLTPLFSMPVRVAVVKKENGSYEARPLLQGELPRDDEQEAFLSENSPKLQ